MKAESSFDHLSTIHQSSLTNTAAAPAATVCFTVREPMNPFAVMVGWDKGFDASPARLAIES